ncbi:hypothetical protein KC19_5G030100 [Ceratodon purpureus]|uniref:Secreted protein n=1 Tax=Ceratodon purpureus TaxID=3225 RepID=A0A8T0HZN5_CERPU|nr:hypothetical protein KC19_5G030100 [Ceratodon purpureus]
MRLHFCSKVMVKMFRILLFTPGFCFSQELCLTPNFISGALNCASYYDTEFERKAQCLPAHEATKQWIFSPALDKS